MAHCTMKIAALTVTDDRVSRGMNTWLIGEMRGWRPRLGCVKRDVRKAEEEEDWKKETRDREWGETIR